MMTVFLMRLKNVSKLIRVTIFIQEATLNAWTRSHFAHTSSPHDFMQQSRVTLSIFHLFCCVMIKKVFFFSESIGLDRRLIIDIRNASAIKFEDSLEFLLSITTVPSAVSYSEILPRSRMNTYPPTNAI